MQASNALHLYHKETTLLTDHWWKKKRPSSRSWEFYLLDRLCCEVVFGQPLLSPSFLPETVSPFAAGKSSMFQALQGKKKKTLHFEKEVKSHNFHILLSIHPSLYFSKFIRCLRIEYLSIHPSSFYMYLF